MESSYVPDRGAYLRCLASIRKGEPCALATVVAASGSSPQTAGSSAVVTSAGLAYGTVGGGRVEAASVAAARKALKTGLGRLLAFDLTDDDSEEADAVCGGQMRVLVDADLSSSRPAFERLARDLSRRGRGVLASFFDPKTRLVKRRWRTSENLPAKPEFARAPGGWLYLEPHFPPARLVIAGAGHVGRAVAHQAGRLGFETIVLDDRPELANRDWIPDAGRFIVGDIAAALGRIVLGGDAFVVIVTRGHRYDAEALRACIRRRTAYLGMMGSARKIALMKDDFLAKGWATPAQWARVHAPIGLPIGSRTVEEIAVSIAAELIAVRRGIALQVVPARLGRE